MTNVVSAGPNFLHCCTLNGRGGADPVDSQSIPAQTSGQGTLWVHLDVNDEASQAWLNNESGLESVIVDVLLADETRPRSLSTDRGLLVVLRGVNSNPGADPEDMVSIRVWIEKNRIISTRRRRLLSIIDIQETLKEGIGPKSSSGFLSSLVTRLADRVGEFIDDIEERVGEAEVMMATQDQTQFRQMVSTLRHQIASVRRFLAPQRDALDRLYRQPGDWLMEVDIRDLRDEADRITRYLEDLDLARERTMVLREEFLGQLAQEQNSRMYVLSVVAAIFLPLTFVTGLLGMNVGGLPGVESPWGFAGSIVIMVLAGLGLAVFFRSKKWL
ncbi:MAG: zinc transporter ZntB [Gammaproteobacteria bacterium]|nr:zinc transporter ZntB [Gammaproteobacteria bacterium]